ncbi:hypothetical protein [Aquipuribacter hungaricus]|uniref:Uncharacterized protein n=1 Tax=Aquipuribacter hungaricus TaxID=545624 RepID=A0ABV7WAZ9_9MICO
MRWSEQDRADFAIAMGESFAAAVCPPVPVADASPQECCEAVRLALGVQVTPVVLAAVDATRLDSIAAAFGQWFETDPPSRSQVEAGVAATLARWPAE